MKTIKKTVSVFRNGLRDNNNLLYLYFKMVSALTSHEKPKAHSAIISKNKTGEYFSNFSFKPSI